MRNFVLQRSVDESGISGTGDVAEGVVFFNGKVTLCWRTAVSSVAIYDNISELQAIHGHNGKTTIRWLDKETPRDAPQSCP